MRIALAQTRPITGDVAANMAVHRRLAELAVAHGAQVVAFAELSATGYEPSLAGALAMDVEDARFEPLQRLADAHGMTFAVGAPTRAADKPRISLVLLAPHARRRAYSKAYLHADEVPFFASGPRTPGFLDGPPRIGLAICYELSVAAHAEAAFDQGAGVYLASVAKTRPGVEAASTRLAAIAAEHGAPVLMVNCVGPCDGATCAGGSAVWDRRGEQLAKLDDGQGLLVFDTETGATVVEPSAASTDLG